MGRPGRALRRLRQPDALGAVRRAVGAAVDAAWAPRAKRWSRVRPEPVDPAAEPRVALVTVNLSTTRELRLMLATLSAQESLGLVQRIVVVDNGSRDGGLDFLRTLDARVPEVVLVTRRRFPTHAHGMRAGIAALRRAEVGVPHDRRCSHLLFLDTDVVWRRPDALGHLAEVSRAARAALTGEWRTGVNPAPDIQASCFLVRRDAYDDPRTPPPLDGGSPAYRLQRSLVDRGFPVADFPGNREGYLLHRGRTGVVAAGAHHPRHRYARAVRRTPHYMGVPDGAAIWARAEATHAALIDPGGEVALADRIATALARGRPTPA